MHNADLIAQLDALTEAAAALRQDLARSDDMLPPPMATAIVRAMKLNVGLDKLATDARKQLAPLFGPNGDGGQAEDKPKPKRPKK